MVFKKAEPQQAYLKICGYGPSGRGKTFTTLLFAEGLVSKSGKRIAYVDTEHGTDFYSMDVKERKIHPKAFDFDVIHTQSIADVLDAVKSLNPDDYEVIVIDSISHLWDACQNAVPENRKTSAGTIPMHMWANIKRPYKELVKFLMEAPFHVFVLGRQKNVFEDADGQMQKVGVAMRAEGETEYEFNIGLRFDLAKGKDGKKATVLAIAEKDRTGILSGRTFPNPNFDMIKPVLPLLNGQQATFESVDEIAEKDQALVEGNSPEKQMKSLAKHDEFKKAIESSKTIDALNEIAKKIKSSRIVSEDHKKPLRALYEHQKSVLAPTVN